MDATNYATCIDQEAAARARVARYWSPTRTPEMTGRTFRHWSSPAFRAAFVAAWSEHDDACGVPAEDRFGRAIACLLPAGHRGWHQHQCDGTASTWS